MYILLISTSRKRAPDKRIQFQNMCVHRKVDGNSKRCRSEQTSVAHAKASKHLVTASTNISRISLLHSEAHTDSTVILTQFTDGFESGVTGQRGSRLQECQKLLRFHEEVHAAGSLRNISRDRQ